MGKAPERFYVQRSQSDSTYGPPRGWETILVLFDRESADRYVQDFERATLFEDGLNVSELVSTVARVVTPEDLLAEGGSDALAAAEAATRVQYEQRMAERERETGPSD